MPTDASLEPTRQAQTALSDQGYRHLLENIEQGFCLIEMIYDEVGRASDYRFLEANRDLPCFFGPRLF
jgi:hypothetical protein